MTTPAHLAQDVTLPDDAETLGDLATLAGDWRGDQGWSITAMPAPGAPGALPAGFILDSKPYAETWRFEIMPGSAPNRGGAVDQFIGG